MDEEEPLFAIGDVIKDQYKLIKKISQGEFRQIYLAFDLQMRQLAIKLEKDSEEQMAVCIEAAILKILTGQKNFPQFFQYGSHMNYKFVTMELMGPNMIDLVNYRKPYRFSLHSILKFGIQAIDILHVLHSKKVVHRDIKP
ncbi:MAG: hypothetical protein EZS28_029575, partial [Streblomastix strix]